MAPNLHNSGFAEYREIERGEQRGYRQRCSYQHQAYKGYIRSFSFSDKSYSKKKVSNIETDFFSYEVVKKK